MIRNLILLRPKYFTSCRAAIGLINGSSLAKNIAMPINNSLFC